METRIETNIIVIESRSSGQFVHEDIALRKVSCLINKKKCEATFESFYERILHYKKRIVELGKSPDDLFIAVVNVDDVNGMKIAKILSPNSEEIWEKMRENGEVPFVSGLVEPDGIPEFLRKFDPEAADKLENLEDIAVIVVDNTVAEIFSV